MALHTLLAEGPEPGTATLHVVGEAHQETSAALARALDDALGRVPHTLTVDCSALTFCTSAGLNAVLQARRTGHRQGTTLRLSGVQPQLRRLLRITEADTVLDFEPVGDGAADAAADSPGS